MKVVKFADGARLLRFTEANRDTLRRKLDSDRKVLLRLARESRLQLKRYSRQRRQMNQDRMFAAHPFAGFALNAA